MTLLPLVVLAGCAKQGMISKNTSSNFYTLSQVRQDYTWLNDVADGWRTVIDMDAKEAPSFEDMAAYPLGNGEIFGIIGLTVPFGSLSNVIGPGYQKVAGFYSGIVPGVMVSDGLERMPQQMIEWVRLAGIVHSVQRNERLALHTYDWVDPEANVWYRLVIAENIGDEPLNDVSLVMGNNNPVDSAENGVLQGTRAGSRFTIGVIGKAFAHKSGLEFELPEALKKQSRMDVENGMSYLACPIGKIAKGESGGKLFYFSLENPEEKTEVAAHVKDMTDNGLECIVRAYEANSAWHKKGLVIGTPDKKINDFVEIQKHIIRVQQARTGGFSPMDRYTYTWIRDSVGPVRFFSQCGYTDEVNKYLQYQHMGNAKAKEIRLNLGLELGEPVEFTEPDWSKYPVDRAEVPSYIVLHHYWYYLATGDRSLIEKHWQYLRRCISGQSLSERGTLPFHGDETYRFPGYMAFREHMDVHDYVQMDCHSADSAFEYVAAAEAMARMARDLGRADEAGEFADKAEQVRAATERYYWMADRRYYAPAMSDFTSQQHRYPFASINMRPMWIGYAGPDTQQRSNVVNSLQYLWETEKSGVRATPAFGYYTTMVPGFVLYNLAEINHPYTLTWLQHLLDCAESSGGFAEMNTPDDRPAETIWGQHRARPWEGGINAHAVIYALLGVRADAVSNHLSLTPNIGEEWQVMGASNIPVGDARVDTEIYNSRGKRIYEFTAHGGTQLPTLDLHLRVPARRIVAIEGAFADCGGRVEDQTYADGITTIDIIGIAMPEDETVPIEVTFEQETPPVQGLRPAKFYYGAAEVTGNQKTLLLTWNPLTYKHYQKQLGSAFMAIDTKIPWPDEFLRGLLLPAAGRRGFDTVLLDVEQYSGGFRRPAYWKQGKGAQLLREFKALGGKVENAKGTTELPASYRNLPREQ